jgi:hypothetical protein
MSEKIRAKADRKGRKDFVHVTLEDTALMRNALLEADEHIQKAKDLINKYGQGGMFLQEEIDSHMKHTAQLFRLHRTGSLRISGLALDITRCIHCGDMKSWHGKEGYCPSYLQKPGQPHTKFRLRKVRFDAWQKPKKKTA